MAARALAPSYVASGRPLASHVGHSESALQDFSRRCCKTCTTSAVFGIYIYEAVVYNGIFLWQILPALGKASKVLPYAVVFNATLGLALWSYIVARTADAGKVPRRWQEFVSNVGDLLMIEPSRSEWQPGKATYCSLCGVPRPERAHHCKTCGHCILRMDHHCPWLSNCVGFANHKYFLLAVLYGFIISCIGFGTTMPHLATCTNELIYGQDNLPQGRSLNLQSPYIWGFLIFGAIATVSVPVLGAMLAAHVALTCRNTTSVEGYYDDDNNPFMNPSSAANLAQICGDFGLDWFFPIVPAKPISDGISFERVDDQSHIEINRRLRGRDIPPEQVWRARYGIPSRAVADDDEELAPSPTSWPGLFTWWGNDEADDKKTLLPGKSPCGMSDMTREMACISPGCVSSPRASRPSSRPREVVSL